MANTAQPLVISLRDARHAYFIHQGTVYSVSACTPDQFRAFIALIAPTWTDTDVRSVLAQESLDIFSRWYVLSVLEKRLASSGHQLPLYIDKECQTVLASKYDTPKSNPAKKALGSKSGRAKTEKVQLVVKRRVRTTKRVRGKTDMQASA